MEKERIIKTDHPAFQTREGDLSVRATIPAIQRQRTPAEIRENWFGKKRMSEASPGEKATIALPIVDRRW